MNLVQTLYIDSSKHPLADSFGWLRPEYHLMSWALSCLQLQRLEGNVELFANSAAAELLTDVINLPYTKVFTTHDDLVLADARLWALPKLYTYSLQENPFLHVDGDVFIFDKLPEALLQSQLIAQNIEIATEYYNSTQRQMQEHFTYFPHCVKADFDSGVPILAVNAGILGGSDISFIKQYTSSAFEYVTRNVRHFEEINVDRFNVFFEQHLFSAMAKERNLDVKYLFDGVFNDRGYTNFGNFHEVPFARSYLHLLGHYKRDEITCQRMAAKLRELYPEYYYRIVAIFKKGKTTLFTRFYNDKAIEEKSDYQSLIEKSATCFITNTVLCDTEQKASEPNLSFLNAIFSYYSSRTDPRFDLQHFKEDYSAFYSELLSDLYKNISLSEYYLYGRDLMSQQWYSNVIAATLKTRHISFQRTKGLYVIKSSFNWAGLFNKHYRIGIKYYENLIVSEGQFFNLVVPELFGEKFVLYDIDGLGAIILEFLTEPMSANELLAEMKQYFEKDVIQNHFDAFSNLIVKIVSQLVVFKAIRPIPY